MSKKFTKDGLSKDGYSEDEAAIAADILNRIYDSTGGKQLTRDEFVEALKSLIPNED